MKVRGHVLMVLANAFLSQCRVGHVVWFGGLNSATTRVPIVVLRTFPKKDRRVACMTKPPAAPIRASTLRPIQHKVVLLDQFTHVDQGIAHPAKGRIDANIGLFRDLLEAHAEVCPHDHYFALFFR